MLGLLLGHQKTNI